MDRHERALIDTGEATSPRKECRGTYPSWCRVLSGSPGLNFLNFILTSSLSSSIFPSHNRCHLLKSYITTGTIALSKAVVPINTSSFGISRNLDKTNPTHATRCQTTPINLMHKKSNNCKTQL